MRNKVFSHSRCGDCGPWSRVWLVRSDRELIAGHTCYSTAYHEVPRDSSSFLACSYYGTKGRIIGSRRCKSCDRISFSSRALDSNRNHAPTPSKIPPAVMFLIFTARFCDVTICLLNQRIAFTFAFIILCLFHDAFAQAMLSFPIISNTCLRIQLQIITCYILLILGVRSVILFRPLLFRYWCCQKTSRTLSTPPPCAHKPARWSCYHMNMLDGGFHLQ
jgi:hypothetical protein